MGNTLQRSVERNQVRIITEATGEMPADTTIEFRDTLISNVVRDFATYRSIDMGVSLRTTIFGTKNFKKGPIRGIRHLMKPSVRFSFSPDQRNLQDTIRFFDTTERELVVTKFDEGPFGSPRFSALQSQISYGVENVLELKYFSKKDSTEKKFKVFDTFSFTGSKNFAADSLKWGQHRLTTRTRLFKGITELRSNWTFDPYLEKNNRSIATTVWSDRQRPLRLERADISLSNNISFNKVIDWFRNRSAEEEDDSRQTLAADEIEEAPSNTPEEQRLRPEDPFEERAAERTPNLRSIWDFFNGTTLRHELRYDITQEDGRTTSELRSHTLTVNGSFDLTENWNVRIGNLGYDFKGRGLSYAAVTFTRKLHCWNMSVSWFPDRGNTYNFAIGVNSGTLSFLQYNYGQNNTDGFFNGRF